MLKLTARETRFATNMVKRGLAVAMLCSGELHAAAEDDYHGIAFGAATLLPALRSELRYDDNIFESAANQRDSTIALLMPALATRLELGNSYYELGYNAEAAKYIDSADDNYIDHNVQALANMQVGVRNNLTLSANFAADHEDRGTGLTEGFDVSSALNLDEPDEYEQTDASVRYTYGARGAAARLALEASYKELEYQNHRLRTALRDREESGASATFYYRIRPSTSLLLQARASAIDYASDFAQQTTLDSDLYRYLIGAEWDNSEQLSGAVKFGYQQKRFDAAGRDDFSAPGWEVDLTWSPRSYAHINFKTERGSQETNGGGDFIDVQRISTEWTHEWNDRVQTLVGLAYEDEKFENFDRDEQVTEFSATLTLQLKRWLALQLGGRYRERTSNLDVLDFNRSIFSAGLEIKI